MSDRYDSMSLEEYLRYTDDLIAGIDDDTDDESVRHLVELVRGEYRLAWGEYVKDFE